MDEVLVTVSLLARYSRFKLSSEIDIDRAEIRKLEQNSTNISINNSFMLYKLFISLSINAFEICKPF